MGELGVKIVSSLHLVSSCNVTDSISKVGIYGRHDVTITASYVLSLRISSYVSLLTNVSELVGCILVGKSSVYVTTLVNRNILRSWALHYQWRSFRLYLGGGACIR